MDGVRVTNLTGDVGVAEARARFGGVDIPATIAGAPAALVARTHPGAVGSPQRVVRAS